MLEKSDRSRQWGETVDDIEPSHIMRYIFAALHSDGRILDAACGCGYGSSILAKKGLVVGVDANKDAIDWANKYFPGPQYCHGWIEDRPWEGEFETVVSLETIEHLQDPSPALEAFRKACVGRFIASVPNEERYPFKAYLFKDDLSPHFRHYTPMEFQALLNAHGFSVTEKFSQEKMLAPEPMAGTDGRFLIYICE